MPRFAIIIPAFDSARTLREAIDSALAQQHSDFQVVLSDNASSDSTAEIVGGYSDRRFTAHLHADRLPKTENWNRAYAAAPDCEFLVTLHSDDRLHPTALARIEAAIRSETVMVHGSASTIDADGQLTGRISRFPLPYEIGGPSQQELLLLGFSVNIVGAAVRRVVFEACGGWPPRWTYLQDHELWFQLAARGRTAYVSHRLGDYRIPRFAAPNLAYLVELLEWHAEKAEADLPPRFTRAAIRSLADISRTVATGNANDNRVALALGHAQEVLGRSRLPRFNRHRRQLAIRLGCALGSLGRR